MTRRKTTVYLDDGLLRAAKVYAARKDLRDSDVIEAALREYLGLDLFESVWARNTELDGDEALRIANDEVAAVRAERRRGR